jgi:hypothetical protein
VAVLRRVTQIGAASTLACLFLTTTVAAAPPHAVDAETLIKKGNDLRRAHDDLGALPLLQQAYAIQPGPRTAVQLGLVEQALGRWADADEHLTTGLRSKDDPWIQRNRAVIDDSVRKVKPHVARIEITGEPVGAEALVNGRAVGKVPLPAAVRVGEGSVDVELRAPGYGRAFRTLTVRGGQYQPVVIRLQPEGPTPPNVSATWPPRLPPEHDPPALSSESVSGPPLATPTPMTDAPPPTEPPPRWRPWAIGASSAGAVVAGGAGVYGMLRHDTKVHEFNERMCLETPSGVVRRPLVPDDQCVSLNTAYRDARTLSILGFSAAGVLGATALLLYLTTPDPGASTETAMGRPRCSPDLVHAGIICQLRF